MSGCDGNSCVDGSCGCRPPTREKRIGTRGIHMLLLPSEKKALQAKSEELGISMSQLSRLAVKAFLKQGLLIPGADK